MLRLPGPHPVLATLLRTTLAVRGSASGSLCFRPKRRCSREERRKLLRIPSPATRRRYDTWRARAALLERRCGPATHTVPTSSALGKHSPSAHRWRDLLRESRPRRRDGERRRAAAPGGRAAVPATADTSAAAVVAQLTLCPHNVPAAFTTTRAANEEASAKRVTACARRKVLCVVCGGSLPLGQRAHRRCGEVALERRRIPEGQHSLRSTHMGRRRRL